MNFLNKIFGIPNIESIEDSVDGEKPYHDKLSVQINSGMPTEDDINLVESFMWSEYKATRFTGDDKPFVWLDNPSHVGIYCYFRRTVQPMIGGPQIEHDALFKVFMLRNGNDMSAMVAEVHGMISVQKGKSSVFHCSRSDISRIIQ